MKALFITHHHTTVDTFDTCGFSVRMRKYAQCGPRLNLSQSKCWKLIGNIYSAIDTHIIVTIQVTDCKGDANWMIDLHSKFSPSLHYHCSTHWKCIRNSSTSQWYI